ncbi:MAG TPA: M23 family metallopeptidase, partial [Promineifilum sp.]|nr:M23 family metallopeptidase [Promineifilum sp.]
YIGGLPGTDDVVIDPYRGRLADVRIYDSPSLLGFPAEVNETLTTTPEDLAVQPTATTVPATPASPAATIVPPTLIAATPQATAVAQANPPVVVGTPPPFGIHTIPLFDLPFPYNGGNSQFGGSAAQFFNAVQGAYNDGRITSYYDHQYPLYPPGFNGLEPEQYDGKMVTYSGAILDTVYSGHPGYDTAPFEPHQATTPLFAAADGVIQTATIHGASGGYYVEIFHRVPGLGNFQSRYWHLEPDKYFGATRDRIGEFVKAGTRIGTIGNTGWSTGHHLHFEVRFDADNDGRFERNEIVDPFGFIPLSPFAPDPWQTGVDVTRKDQTFRVAGPASPYLWKYPMGTTAVMPDAGGGRVAIGAQAMGGEGGATLCIPEDSTPPGSTVNFSLIPDPPPSASLVGTGNGCILSAFTPDGKPVTSFDPPIEVYLPFEPGDLANIDRPRETLSIYWLNPDTGNYEPRPTTIDFNLGLAYATLDRPGHCSLMGLPNRDLVAPATTIGVDGPAVDGVFSDRVSITLTAGDDQSGVEAISYSLDNGDTWLPYEGPFSIPTDDLALWPPRTEGDSDAEEGLPIGPGRYLVLAESRDSAGNVENPPAARIIVIDPRLQQMTPTPVAAVTPIITVEACVRATNWFPYQVQRNDTW